MATLRGIMGFLIAGTTVWLLYVLAAQMDSARLAFVEVGLLVLALFVWLQGRSRGAAPRILGRVGAVPRPSSSWFSPTAHRPTPAAAAPDPASSAS